MEQAEYLDKCLIKLNLDSDSKLGAALKIPRMRISDYRLDKIKFDEYACFKVAEVLGEDPSLLIAQVLAIKSKNEAKRLYFKDFLTTVGLWITLAVIPLFLGSHSGSVQANGIDQKVVINQHNGSLYETAKTYFKDFLHWLKVSFVEENFRYCTCN